MLTMVGDSCTGAARARELSSLQTLTTPGTTAATLAAGGPAAWLGWRVVFAVTAAGAALSLVLLRRVRLPAVKGARREVCGLSTALAGAVGATYGAGTIGGAYLARQVVARMSRTAMIATGSSTLFVAFLPASLSQAVTALTATPVLIGTSNAFLHSSPQGWGAEVAPGARAPAVSLFVASVFLGGSAATGLSAGLARSGYGSVFTATCGDTVVPVALAVGGHVLWSRRRTG